MNEKYEKEINEIWGTMEEIDKKTEESVLGESKEWRPEMLKMK